jgi:hypothetical protein
MYLGAYMIAAVRLAREEDWRKLTNECGSDTRFDRHGRADF